MTVEAYSGLPFQAGSAVAAVASRGALWAISAYVRQPLRNTALAALIGLSAMAGANALYKQAHHHPAPMFGSFAAPAAAVKSRAQPVMPAERPRQLLVTSTETTGSVDNSVTAPKPLGSDDVLAVQRKLLALSLFTGTADGLYGPRTARAVKAFEQRAGRVPKGVLTPDLIALIEATPIEVPPAQIDVAPAVTPEPAASVPTEPQTQTQTLPSLALVEPNKPLPAPAPLLAVTADGTEAPAPLAKLDLTGSSDAESAAASVAVAPAADAIDSIVEKTTLPLALTDGATIVKHSVATIAVHAAPAAEQTIPAELAPVTEGGDPATDPTTVAAVQRGLSSLGFLHGEIDGVAGEATSKAIRNFEVYYNFDVTGQVTPGLVNLLVQSGAVI